MNCGAKSQRQSDIKVKVLFFLISFILATCPFARAQAEREFIDKANGFKITLVGNWRAEPYTDAVGRRKTEFVCENRDLGLLRITRENLTGGSLQDLVRRQINDFALCNSCVSIAQETFAGTSLSGIRVALYYVEGDRRIVGTFYFLQDKGAVWILRFSGRAGSPGIAHGLTDRMARSFCRDYALY
jgi:hypothetical protein